MSKGVVRLTIKFNRDYNEYSVNPYINGGRSEEKTYYTDDKQDANDTLITMREEFKTLGYDVLN